MAISISYEDLKAIVPRYSGPKGIRQNEICREAAAILPALLDEFAVNTPLRAAHFLAQLAHESAGFRTTREFASGAAYEGRKDLGNVRKGDGTRFRGRGLIQVTGRSNYTAFTKWMRRRNADTPSFVANPDALEAFPWALYSAFWYWTTRGLNKHADKDDVRAVTKIINGGFNGLKDREAKLAKAKRRLSASKPSTPSTVNMLQRGDRGEAVRRWQETLVFLGHPITVDGFYGTDTFNATSTMQARLNLTVDGIAGPETMTAGLELARTIAAKAVASKEATKKAAEADIIAARKEVPVEVETVLDDADKPLGKSKQFWATVIGFGTSAITAIQALDPIVAVAIIVVVAIAAGFLIWDRKRKADMARTAKAAIA